MAFYEKYGSYGVSAFEKTVAYAKSKCLVVVEDGKRNDIGNTARAYADGHLGNVELLDGSHVPSLSAIWQIRKERAYERHQMDGSAA